MWGEEGGAGGRATCLGSRLDIRVPAFANAGFLRGRCSTGSNLLKSWPPQSALSHEGHPQTAPPPWCVYCCAGVLCLCPCLCLCCACACVSDTVFKLCVCNMQRILPFEAVLLNSLRRLLTFVPETNDLLTCWARTTADSPGRERLPTPGQSPSKGKTAREHDAF